MASRRVFDPDAVGTTPEMRWLRSVWASLDFGGRVLGVVGVIVLGIGLLTGFWHLIRQFPWYSQLLLAIGLGMLIGWGLLQRRNLSKWLRQLYKPRREHQSIAFISSGGDFNGMATNNLMQFGGPGGDLPSLPDKPVSSSAQALRRQGRILGRLGDDLTDLLAQHDAQERQISNVEWLTQRDITREEWHRRTADLERRHQALGHQYLKEFDAEIIAAYLVVRSKGFVNQT